MNANNMETGANAPSGVKKTGWENMAPQKVDIDWNEIGDKVLEQEFGTEFIQKKKHGETQQRKIVATMMYGDKYLTAPDVELPEGDLEKFAVKVATGEVNQDAQRAFIDKIADPIHTKGVEAVNNQIGGDKHMRRILGFSLFGNEGFGNYLSVMGPDSVQNFIQKYPSPMDFDSVSEQLLSSVKATNGDKKYMEYKESMETFKKDIYGKRQEYWDQMKALKEKGQDKMKADARARMDMTYGLGEK